MMLMDGTCRCDRCGADLPNESLLSAVIVSDVDTSEGRALTMHFGRKCGCAMLVLPGEAVQYRVGAGLPVGDATNPPEDTNAEAPAPDAGDGSAG